MCLAQGVRTIQHKPSWRHAYKINDTLKSDKYFFIG